MSLLPANKTTLFFALGLAGPIAIGLLILGNVQQLTDDYKWVAHTNQVLTDLEAAHGAIWTADAAQRNFVLTGQPADLNSYRHAIQRLDITTDRLHDLTKDNSVQQQLIATFNQNLARRRKQLNHGIELRTDRGLAAASKYVELGSWKTTMADIRSDIAEMQAEENRLLRLREAESRLTTQRTLAAAAVGTAVSMAVIILAFFQLTKEISVRKQTEEALRTSEELLQTFLDHNNAVMFLKDPEGRYLLVNRAFETVYGLNRNQIIGRTDYDVFPAGLADRFRANDRKVIEAAIPVNSEVLAPLSDGDHTYILSMFTIRQAAGHEYVLGGFAADITDRKRMEEEVLRLNKDLERRAVQLEATNSELESFSYSVSHDLRAPLRSIDGFSQALAEDYGNKLDEVGHSYLQRVRAATQRMGILIDDMLSLSRVTRSELVHSMTDLSALAEAVAQDLRLAGPDRAVRFSIEKGLIACCDARLIKLVLENLIGNAWKFTARHSEAHIEFGAIDIEGERAFFVRDDGAGFDDRYADKLFGAFQRLHAMNDFEGTGIGLATVARIVRRHNGRVWAKGAVGKGATFFFTL